MSQILSGRRTLAALSFGLAAFGVQAALVQVKVTVESLAPANSISFAPLHVGFNNGSFDAFNLGGVATAPIISVAEGGAASPGKRRLPPPIRRPRGAPSAACCCPGPPAATFTVDRC